MAIARGRTWRQRGISVFLLVALAGCKQGANIKVVQLPIGVTFLIKDAAGNKPRCASDITAYPASPDDAAPMWRIVAGGYDRCVSRVAYGSTPAGFAHEQPALPLQQGKSYRVAAYGAGFVGFEQFTRAAE